MVLKSPLLREGSPDFPCQMRSTCPSTTSSLSRGPILSSSPRILFTLRQVAAKAGHLFDKQARSQDPQTERRPS